MAPGTEPVLDTAQPHTVRRIIDSYTPQVVPSWLWERIGPTVRALMHPLDLDSMHVARTDLPMVVAYVGRTVTDGRWSPEGGCWPPFDRHLIDGHCNQPVAGTLKSKGRTRGAGLHATGLRHTWMLDLLARGTPVDLIAQAAGISHLHTIERLTHLPPRPADQTVAWLTGTRP